MMGCRFDGEFVSDGAPVEVRHLQALEPEYRTDVYPEELGDPKRMQVFCPAEKTGTTITGKLYVPGEDNYRMRVYLSVGPNFGNVGVVVGTGHMSYIRTVNAYNETYLPWKGFDLGARALPEGAHNLQFVIQNRNEMATGLDFGLVAFQAIPSIAATIRPWSVIGPWQCPNEGGWEVVHPPETEIDLDAEYDTTAQDNQGKQVAAKAKWRQVMLTPGGGVPNHSYFGWGSWQVVYGVTYIWSPDDRVAGAFIAKDDGIGIWVNGEHVLDNNTWSHYKGDQFIAACPLKKGWNSMLVKNCNWHGAWAYAIRLTDPRGELKFTNVTPDDLKK